ncbi:MAG TPA: hypothetical protein VER32_14340 [Pyrinomonadaceae bacterium]|nr:hypothetical protein [Pyrinomonadaceae bacterium]
MKTQGTAKVKVGVMGSADDTLPRGGIVGHLRAKADALGRALAARDVVVLTGATTGLPHLVGSTARRAGAFHVGISPAADKGEHAVKFNLPVGNFDLLIYTGFGLKGRNVVLVRSCDVVLVVGGSMGALNEFTIAHDEGRVIGCLAGTGGAADEVPRLMQTLKKRSRARVFHDEDPARLLDTCLSAFDPRGGQDES